ncbi:MAG: hypothetical protein PHD65_12325 [Gallionella sp.]|nr:hypothetical protein [Gallionella sp.]
MCTSKLKPENRAKSLAAHFECGISLIELIIFIVIVSVALAGIMLVMNTTTRYSADPLIQKQSLTIAESLLEEIELKDFTSGGYSGADRSQFNDIFDYNALSASAVTYANSSVPVTGLESYSVSAVVATLPAAWGNIPAASAAQITVTVVNGPSGHAIEMTGYKVAH